MMMNTSPQPAGAPRIGEARAPNVKSVAARPRYERFGETIRYLTLDEWHQLLAAIDDLRHKLMLRTIYELGCRVGEFVRIRLEHLNLGRATVLFPAANTKTRQRRVSHLPAGLLNELKGMLRVQGRLTRQTCRIRAPGSFLFHPRADHRTPYSENRIRQIFRTYAGRVGLDRVYATDGRGRGLRELTVHSLRHSHIMHYVHVHKLPLPAVQRQVGHKTLKATSVYLRPSDELVGQIYAAARHYSEPTTDPPKRLSSDVPLSLEHDSTNKKPHGQWRPRDRSARGNPGEGGGHR